MKNIKVSKVRLKLSLLLLSDSKLLEESKHSTLKPMIQWAFYSKHKRVSLIKKYLENETF